MSTSAAAGNSPLLLTNGNFTFSPDFTGLQTYSAAVPSTWAPVPGGAQVELPQIGLWIGEPGLGVTNAIGQIANANQSLTPQTGVLTSHFSSDGCFWAVTTVVNPDAPEVAFRVERTTMAAPDSAANASYSADTPSLPDQFARPSQPTAAEYETTHTDIHAGYSPNAGGLPDGVAGSGADAAVDGAGGAGGSAGGAPDFGLFLAMPGEVAGSMSVSHPPGAHGLTGSDTYLVSHLDADHAYGFNASVTVNNGTVHDLGLNEVAIYANGSVLDVVLRFSPADGQAEASASTAAVAAEAAAKWGRNLSEPHGPGAH